MSNRRWDKEGIPHRGWECAGIIDLRDAGFSQGQYENCMMCGQERIRYVHLMEHSELDDQMRVGCICASKMEGDYTSSDGYSKAKQRENKMRNRAARRRNWLKRKWRISAKGNEFLNTDGYNVGVYQTSRGMWGYWIIGDERYHEYYDDKDTAKLALFDTLWIKLNR